MFYDEKVGVRVDRLGRSFKHNVLCLRCDVCGIEWETRGSIADAKHTKVHTCSEACKSIAHKNGGVIERQRAATCVERYGAENPFAAEPCKQKMRSTWKKKYGVDQGLS